MDRSALFDRLLKLSAGEFEITRIRLEVDSGLLNGALVERKTQLFELVENQRGLKELERVLTEGASTKLSEPHADNSTDVLSRPNDTIREDAKPNVWFALSILMATALLVLIVLPDKIYQDLIHLEQTQQKERSHQARPVQSSENSSPITPPTEPADDADPPGQPQQKERAQATSTSTASKPNGTKETNDELIKALTFRADKIQWRYRHCSRQSKNKKLMTAADRFLNNFSLLHSKHIDALKNGEMVLAHDINREISTEIHNLKFDDFGCSHAIGSYKDQPPSGTVRESAPAFKMAIEYLDPHYRYKRKDVDQSDSEDYIRTIVSILCLDLDPNLNVSQKIKHRKEILAKFDFTDDTFKKAQSKYKDDPAVKQALTAHIKDSCGYR